MALIIDKKLPAFAYLKREQVFEISTERAKKQDIRPLEIGILNLMPSAVDEHKSNSKQGHFDGFYKTMSEVKARGLDGLIITGANLEDSAFEDVYYWKELTRFLDWARAHVTSTVFSCWATHAKLYHQYGIKSHAYKKKKFGIFLHQVHHETGSPFLAGMDDEVLIPHSRWRGIEHKDLKGKKDFQILIENKEGGPHLIVGRKGREIYVQGHPEYD